MLDAPIPSSEETRANAAFEALIWSLSRPGCLRSLPEGGQAAIVEALLDRECHVFCADPTLMPKVLESGATLSEIDRADHVFLGALSDLDALPAIPVGSDLYPDRGATVVIRAHLGKGTRLRLAGPGIECDETVRIGGLPGEFWALRRTLIRSPMGFDIFLVDGTQVMGLPRSTTVEVL